ncbi:hypothetical protein BW730_06185 [Tessaracoccus aquimaris]|uniref:Uncharacterized protein n=1 Tax=Tessaracoccus aquimaris TaxID=1332264 RepID=A0A1Q2CM16_9ACTN|nr:hypothetical protein [Tessaracoccus aquimaris]AQP47164.1 hypothetical protein BW730_06185 [Tessaracoccus aquimaris]
MTQTATSKVRIAMGKDKFDELRDDREEQEERREEIRDETLGADDLGSQDERRDEGDREH